MDETRGSKRQGERKKMGHGKGLNPALQNPAYANVQPSSFITYENGVKRLMFLWVVIGSKQVRFLFAVSNVTIDSSDHQL